MRWRRPWGDSWCRLGAEQVGRKTVTVEDLFRLRSTFGAEGALMVTHDNRIVDFADRIIEMEDGRILSGAAESLLAQAPQPAARPDARV